MRSSLPLLCSIVATAVSARTTSAFHQVPLASVRPRPVFAPPTATRRRKERPSRTTRPRVSAKASPRRHSGLCMGMDPENTLESSIGIRIGGGRSATDNGLGRDRCSLPEATSPRAHGTARLPSIILPRTGPAATALLLASLLLLGDATQPHIANAAADSILDANSPAVDAAISALRQSQGNAAETFKAFESINDIITEGKGVGGSINYKGVQLERGYVADEDTTIYNPGLTLLTEDEKTNLVKAVTEARADSLKDGSWNDNSQLAYEFLKDKLDPLHMAELRGYLSVFPIVVGVVYAATLAVQQLARDLFPAAYVVGVALVIAPALALVALGPSQ